MIHWRNAAGVVMILCTMLSPALADDQTSDPQPPAIGELETLRAENALLRRQVDRLLEELASLRAQSGDGDVAQPSEPAAQSEAPAPGDAADNTPLTQPVVLPSDAEMSRLRLIQHRVSRGDAAAATELAALRDDLAMRLRNGAEHWTAHDVEVRIRIDKRICAIMRAEPGSRWIPMIQPFGPIAIWASAAADRDELVARLRLLERHAADDSYAANWTRSFARTLARNVAHRWMSRRSNTYRTEWDREQFYKWLGSRGVKCLQS